jgi:sucrose-6-phosphate hydrolase SacC (GH32 family)
MYWSPHKLHHMTSSDGVNWRDHQILMDAPFHKFFRDPMVLMVAEDQCLLYTTARGQYYSQIDLYQSFDLIQWQFVRSALKSGWGSERNAPFSSMESPFVTQKDGRYYLS